MPRRVLAGVAAVLLLSACGSDGTSGGASGRSATSVSVPSAPPTTAPPLNVVATAKVPTVGVFANPDDPEPARALAHPTQPYGTDLVFLVKEQTPDWLLVHLPVRPNGSTGWIRATEVDLTTHEYRMVIELGAHRLTVWKGDEIFADEPIGVGTRDTPTPGGLYYTKELLQPIDRQGNLIPNGPYGPYAYGLSGFSEVLYDFAGGDGVIGIHGTNDPSSVGRNSSHGCIRLSNEAITRLATTLPIGVPVEIRA